MRLAAVLFAADQPRQYYPIATTIQLLQKLTDKPVMASHVQIQSHSPQATGS